MSEAASAPARRRIIINADDFGLSAGVSRGILEAWEKGLLTSTTMLVNLDGFDDAVTLAKANPELPVGIHLSLLWGPPVSDPALVPSLVEAGGEFPRSLTVLARRYFLSRLSLDEVRIELSAQIRKFLDAGLVPCHVDAHKHVQCLPGVMDALCAACAEHGIEWARNPVETVLAPAGSSARKDSAAPSRSLGATWKAHVIRFLARNHLAILGRHGLRTTDHFIGLDFMKALDAKALRFIFEHAPEGVSEVMCHPGYSDPEANRWSRRPPRREAELAGLLSGDARDAAEEAGVELVSYRDL